MPRILSRGEKPLDWVGSSKKDFLGFPEPVKDEMGNALGVAQFGGRHPSAKPWKGQGPGVFELVEGSISVLWWFFRRRLVLKNQMSLPCQP